MAISSQLRNKKSEAATLLYAPDGEQAAGQCDDVGLDQLLGPEQGTCVRRNPLAKHGQQESG